MIRNESRRRAGVLGAVVLGGLALAAVTPGCEATGAPPAAEGVPGAPVEDEGELEADELDALWRGLGERGWVLIDDVELFAESATRVGDVLGLTGVELGSIAVDAGVLTAESGAIRVHDGAITLDLSEVRLSTDAFVSRSDWMTLRFGRPGSGAPPVSLTSGPTHYTAR